MPLSHYHEEERPWGGFTQFTENEPVTVKLIHVLPGMRLSLQTHENRSEYWRVVEGGGTAEVAGVETPLMEGVSVEIPIRAPHRLTAGPEGILVLELAFGAFDEEDIIRLRDDFGRADGTP